MATIIGSGLIVLDVIQTTAGACRIYAGGSCGNVLAIMTTLQWRSFPVARLEPDHAGQLAAHDLSRAGVSTEFLHLEPRRATPILIQKNRRAKDGSISHGFSGRCPRCRGFLPSYSPVRIDTVEDTLSRLPEAGVFYFDRPSPSNLVLAKVASERGSVVVFEPTSIGKGAAETKRFLKALGLAHTLKYSADRLPELSSREHEFPRQPLVEVETSGAAGLRYRTALESARRHWKHLAVKEISTRGDAAGAGDWTTAGLIFLTCADGLNSFREYCASDVETALRFGQALAAWNCQFEGPRCGVDQDPEGLARVVREHTDFRYAPPENDGAEKASFSDVDAALDQLCPACCAASQTIVTKEAGAALPDQVDKTGRWKVVGRPGYVGRRAPAARKKLDKDYGKDRWRVVYVVGDKVISRDEALHYYTAAYVDFLEKNPRVLDWLVKTARDVYDTAPSNVHSGLDYSKQEGPAVHLQDIAVRIAMARLGRRLEGGELVRIRGRKSRGSALSPGVVPFHRPELIEQPELDGWWEPGTVESFWQSNKVLQVRRERLLIYGGSFNPIHNGHIAAARYARDQLGFERVVFVPNGDAYRKKGLALAVHRLRMVEEAIEDERRFETLDSEVRSKKSFRGVETARELQKKYPQAEIFLYRGVDALPKTHRNYFTIDTLRVLVLDRQGARTAFEEVLQRKAHLRAHRHRIDYHEGKFQFDLSSTDVRDAVTQGRPIETMVPKRVASTIVDLGLYRAAES